LPQFEKETGIKVIVDEMDHDPLREKTLIDFTTETGIYDVVNYEQGWVAEYLAGGFMEPLEPYIEKYNTDVSDFFQPALEYWCRWEGKLYGFPFDIDTRYFFYRKDVFEKYGIDVPASPTEYFSTDEFIDVLAKVNHPEEGYYALGESGAYYGTADLEWRAFFYSFGAEAVLDKNYKPLVNTAPGVEGLEYYVKIGDYAPPGHVTWLWDDLLNAAKQGSVACSIQPSVFAGALMDPEQSKIAGNVGWFSYPQKDDLPVIGVYGGWGIGISKFSKNKDQAYQLIHWLADKKIAAERAKLGAVGASQMSVYMNPEVIKVHPDYLFALERLKSARGFVPRLVINAQIADILNREINQAFVAGKSAQEAMDTAAKDITEVLKRAGY